MLQRTSLENINLSSLLSIFGVAAKTITDKIANFGLGNTAQVMTLGANALGVVHTAMYLRRTMNTMEEGALHQISREHESAVNSYREAQRLAREDSIPAAIETLNKAQREFDHTSSKTRQYQSLTSHDIFQANILMLKAILLLSVRNYQEAAESARSSLSFNKQQPLACNLLAFIHLYHLRDDTLAKKYLNDSLNLNTKQIFANFYLAYLNKDAAKRDSAFLQLRKTFELKDSQSPEIADKIPEVISLTATTLPIFIPHMAIEWLGCHTQAEEISRHELAQIATIFNIVLNSCQSLALDECRGMLLEKRIQVLNKLAELRGAQYEDFDEAWRNEHAKSIQDKNKKHYFLESPIEELDHSFLKLLPCGADPERLLSQSLRADFIKYVIAWAKLGRFSGENHPKVQALNQHIKKMHKPGANLEDAVASLCGDPEVLQLFIEKYLAGKGWRPWFEILRINEAQGEVVHSLILLLCRDLRLSINFFKYDEKGALTLINNNFVNDRKCLHLLTSNHGNAFTVLQPLHTPGAIYRLLAKRDCLSLITVDPNNAVAQQFLSARRLAALPAMAEDLLMTNPKQAGVQLRLFTQPNQNKLNRCVFESITALFSLIVTHTHLAPIADFDVKRAFLAITDSRVQPYVDLAHLLRIRLEMRHVELNVLDDAIKLFFTETSLTQPLARSFLSLVKAELYLHGFNRSELYLSPDREKTKTHVLKFLRDEKIIQGEVTPALLAEYFTTIKNTFLKRYCLGYAAYLLAGVSTDHNQFNEYFSLAKQCGFCPSTPDNLESLTRAVLGVPMCVPVDLQDPYERHGSYWLNQYLSALLKVYSASTLVMPMSAYINYALVECSLSPQWHLPSHNWMSDDIPSDEAWLHLRDSINKNHTMLLNYLFLKVETLGGKPPYSLSEINLEKITLERRSTVANWLIHLLAKSDIKIENYDSNTIYDAATFDRLKNEYVYETKSSCTLS